MTTRHLETLSIGEFGRRAGLSVKALRLYDVSGLLRADSVDPATGYRRYRADQFDRARRISLLRRVEMPLSVMPEVLDAPDDEAVLRLDRWWAAQEAIMQNRRGSVAWLRGQLAHGVISPEQTYEVSARDVPTTKVASVCVEVYQNTLVQTMRSCEWAIRNHLDQQRAVTTPEFWVLYHGPVTPDNDAAIEVCLPFTGAAEPTGEIVIRVEPAHREVYTTVARDDAFYPRIMHAYEAVSTHALRHGLVPSGPEREIYLNDWDQISGTDPFVHVAQPIQE
ncbi:MerR family transcriptional regulator [Paractinoplanes globisporus]|uniref:MerR family transcriptional regulator n=1 Tax=Paractinoplanes globisporus TaxID=113565 RepID=A0ABW6WM19_9ACTN|nr:MerR family transcriptional regulator [Actinoplanes globisporus]